MSKISTNFIIAGVNKAGTTSIHSYLSAHPDICGSNKKETCHFLPLRYGKSIQSISNYSKFFKHCTDEKIIFESTPGYFYGGKKIAHAINSSLEGPKILLVLREPVARAYSFYKFQQSMLNLSEQLDFSTYLDKCMMISKENLKLQRNNKWFGLEGGCYSTYIIPWISTFEDRLKIVFFDELKNNPELLMKDIVNWLGLTNIYDNFDFSPKNKTRGYSNKLLHKIALKTNVKLETFFRRQEGIKDFLRNLYSKINSEPVSKTMSPNENKRLTDYYKPFNIELKKILVHNTQINKFPDWLNDSTIR